MDFGSPPRTSAVASTPMVARSDISAQPGSVAVELPPEKTVQSASAGSPVKLDIGTEADRQARPDEQARRNESPANEAAEQTIQRRIVVEQSTHSIVTQERDPHTGETISTIPDEATLKLRLFAKAMAERRDLLASAGPSIERSA